MTRTSSARGRTSYAMQVSSALALVVVLTTVSRADTLVLNGSGSTFVQPIMARWAVAFARHNPGVEVMYQSLGSGRGVQDTLHRAVDFGATDDPMSDEELARVPGMLHIPIALGGVVVVFNLQGVSDLRLSPEVVARIFMGQVSRWNDPAIARENPGVRLPSTPIFVAHRSDGSGTTAIFTRYMSMASTEWNSGPGAGRTVQWPAGAGFRGNEGVAGAVSRGDGWVGYVELGYALQTKLATMSLRSPGGSYLSPSVEAITLAAARASIPDDFRASLVDTGGAAWPMSGFTWALIPTHQTDFRRAKALVEFLWLCTHDGQAIAPDLGFAPMPASLVGRVEAALRTVRVGSDVVLGAR